MKFLFKFAVITASVLLMGSCCNCRSYQKKSRLPLEETTWQLIQLGGQTIQPAEERFFITLHAAASRLEGRGACNRLMGGYRTDAKHMSLQFESVASTRMACNDPREALFIQALESTTHYDMDGPMLLLLDKGNLLAVFQARP